MKVDQSYHALSALKLWSKEGTYEDERHKWKKSSPLTSSTHRNGTDRSLEDELEETE